MKPILNFYPRSSFWIRSLRVKWQLMLLCILYLVMLNPGFTRASSDGSDLNTNRVSNTLKEILKKIETRYAGSDFSANFDQRSTLAALKISDTASGKVFFKYPGMMRWEYEKPEPQIIITNGTDLWIYRPLDNQVMVGKAPAYFGGGKGASFLSDIQHLKKYFDIGLKTSDPDGFHVLKLIPKKKRTDLVEILLTVEAQSAVVVRVVTRNAYQDETRIQFTGHRFGRKLNKSLFYFVVPKNIDVLQLD